ncbi:uncharacterized protein LOC106055807 [Biomphalaria glabrata]|uniref:Uncharacterized protein LOC106055807 n=1 Tax=Biomphalaria glabrata TaxID=6526 RepID=A0A9U8E042_BIOGL|nr:uncharacterized protein LOC106055807 [Biomphalaria glabrata]
MADVNKNTNFYENGSTDDKIGYASIEGISNHPTLHAGLHRTLASEYQAPVYLGETVSYDVVLKRFNHTNADEWKRLISRVANQAIVVPAEPQPVPAQLHKCDKINENVSRTDDTQKITIKTEESSNDGIICPVLATYSGISSSLNQSQDGSFKPYFRDDDTYVIPMSSCLQDVSGECHFVELRVTLWLYTVTSCDRTVDVETNKKISDSKDVENDSTERFPPVKRKIPVNIKEFFDFGDERDSTESEASPVKVLSSLRSMQEKTVAVRLKVQGPPELKMKHSSAGPKQLLLLKVSNNTDKQMVIKSIQILSSSSPVRDSGMSSFEDRPSVKWESCHQLINLEVPKKSQTFPVILSPWEDLNLIYKLNLSSVPSDSELSLRANVKWTHAGATHEITTLYKLPRIRIRCPPFIVTVKCDEEVVLGKTFFVTYSISNQLHDFMSMKLYYNLDNMIKAVSENGTNEEMHRVQLLKDSIVCHDPDIAISACPRGSCVPIRVGFQIHKPGLYELSELMKVNLRYSLPDPLLTPIQDDRESCSTSSDTSVSIQSTDDHLLASEELWRGRSGSTASLATPVMYLTAEERRRSFAAKSYSFGDLGPTISAESDEAGNLRTKVIQRSSAVPPPRPPPPRMLSQTERDLIKPSNFLKQPFYIYVKDPLM